MLTGGLGRPVSTDLSVIGKGKPTLVLAYANYSPTGGDALNRLSRVTKDYESRIEFVVADLGVPEGRNFAARHQLVDGQALFLMPDGRPLRTMSIPADERELRSRLDTRLADLE